jgi:uncharacterized protein (TIGR00297 family)
MQLLTGFSAALIISYLAWRVKALSLSGALAASVVGGMIFGLGGLPWAAILLVFFLSSSLLSRAFPDAKSNASRKYAKDSRRDWAQVLANGGLGMLLVICYALFPSQNWLWVAYCAAFAAVNADTWSTELGVLSSMPPRLITNGKIVEAGTSGGVSLIGGGAALGGSFLIAASGAFLNPVENPPIAPAIFVFVITLAGFLGSLVDSLLGASIQAVYFCPSCGKQTESHPEHLCGNQTTLLRGWRWLDNDLVNFVCALSGASIAFLLVRSLLLF